MDQPLTDLYALRDDLLIALAKAGAWNKNPISPLEVLRTSRPDIDWNANKQIARDAGWLLVKNNPPFARVILVEGKEGTMFLALTVAGKAGAAALHQSRQPQSFISRLRAIPRSDWIALGALIVSVFALLNKD